MRTHYIPHKFGETVERELRSRIGWWLTAGVASSIAWPSNDVWLQYNGDDYFLRGSERNGKPSPPGITVPCDADRIEDALAKIYRFTSVLSWFMEGYVQVVGYVSGNCPILYEDRRNACSIMGVVNTKSFNCNYMPIIDKEHIRKALAFWREGQLLRGVHDSYAFLSFYKVIESQFSDSNRDRKLKVAWFNANIKCLTDHAAKRVAELQQLSIDVSKHLFESGRCAVAHASLSKMVVDPDIPADRRRLSDDLVMIEELARIYIQNELKVPNLRSLYHSRNHLAPWDYLLPDKTVEALKNGSTLDDVSGLHGIIVSIGVWPDGPIAGLENMTLHVDAVDKGVIKIVTINQRNTIFLVFFLDYQNGRAHTNLEDGGLLYGHDENDVRAYATFFYRVLGNGIAELSCRDIEPISCEVVIPVNIIPPDPDSAIAEAIDQFQKANSTSSSL